MDWLEVVGDINYWGVVLAVLSTFAVGMVWYAEGVFGKRWMKLSGLTKKDMENRDKVMKAMVSSLVGSVFTAVVLASLMFATVTDGWVDGAVFGAVVGVAFMMASQLTHDGFAQKDMMLTKINSLHDIVSTAVMGAIIGGVGF